MRSAWGMTSFQHITIKRGRIVITCDDKTGHVRVEVVSPDMSRILIEVIDMTELELR